ncbi:hypothetical protein ACSBR2_015315 [Camellia fascicularis]
MVMVSQTRNVGFIAFLVCSVLVGSVISLEPSSEVQIEALKAFKNSITNDPFGALLDWNDTKLHHCNWSGIACDTSSNQVISVSFPDKQLRALLELGIIFNNLTGTIPSNFGNLVNLQLFVAFHNSLVGSIPTSIGRLEALQAFDLSQNQLSGLIPREIGNLTNLEELLLFNNLLVGKIPSELGHCRKLVLVNIYTNQFTGSIPPELGHLANLEVLRLYQNKLNSTIPLPLFQAKSIIYLGLSQNELMGTIPSAIGSLRSLRVLTLHSNRLTGEIPLSLTNLSNVTYLSLGLNFLTGSLPSSIGLLYNLKNLSSNRNLLEGSIPSSITNCHVPESGIFKNINAFSLEGNQALSGTTSYLSPCRTKNYGLSKKTILILAVLGSVSVLLFLVLVLCIFNRYTKKEKPQGVENSEPEYASALSLERFDQKDLEQATDFFSEDNVIGASSLSTVYKGRLEDGQTIAVKKLNLQQFPAESNKCFYNEIKTLSQLRHRNLVKILGYAWESRKLKALVLEYMENGNLESIIHDPCTDHSRWTLSHRIDTLVSVASGLVYLHSGYDFPIVHCDLKPSNILLDEKWEAHVSDFGTARMLGVHLQDGSSLSSSAFQGTIGYIAPEFAYMRKVTTKVDVFSFGIIVMELLTKRRPTGLTQEDGLSITLPQLVERALANGINRLLHVVDPLLASQVSKEQEMVEALLKLALSCTCTAPEDRPNIDEILSSILKLSKNRIVSKQ